MSGMNEFLSQYYNTGAASAPAETDMNEDLHKQASIELFCKLAASNNVDLESCSEEQIRELFADFQKTASDDKGDKKEEAKKELEEKKAAAEKTAEADYLGRVMAHSYIDELQKIAAEKGMVHVPGGGSSSHGHPGRSNAAKGMKGGESAGFMKVRHALEKGKDKAKELAGKAGDAAGKAGKFLGKHKHFAGAAAAGAAGVAAGAALAGKKKEASAIDELAASAAIEKAAAGNYDVDEAAEKIAAVLVLVQGTESEKTAGVFDVDQAVDIRSLELLEMAGYPVTWPE